MFEIETKRITLVGNALIIQLSITHRRIKKAFIIMFNSVMVTVNEMDGN